MLPPFRHGRVVPCTTVVLVVALLLAGCSTLDHMASARLASKAWRAARAEKPKEAELLYMESIRRDPDYAAPWTDLAILCLEQRRSRMAADLLEESVRRWPANLRARHYLGIALLQAGEVDKAERCFMGVLERDSQYAASWYGMALVAGRRGDQALALECLLQALKRDPDSGIVLKRLKDTIVAG